MANRPRYLGLHFSAGDESTEARVFVLECLRSAVGFRQTRPVIPRCFGASFGSLLYRQRRFKWVAGSCTTASRRRWRAWLKCGGTSSYADPLECLNQNGRMSATGYKRTYSGQLANVRFTPESGHSEAQERLGLKKRTLDVRFAPKSGHKWLWRGMSAFDPKRTLAQLRACASTSHSAGLWLTVGKYPFSAVRSPVIMIGRRL